jgi:PTH1 family peptidyl-tRNA hydrolase
MIVGLGNPGPEYARNRHNVGFQVIDLFAGRHGLVFDKFQKQARVALGRVALTNGWAGRVLLAKPMTFMNLSGEAVAALAAFYKIAPVDILVISDDLDLPAGKLRLRAEGGAGGQKGIKSTIQHLHTEAFPRLRIGIGRPPGQMDAADYVLQNFSAAEEQEMAFLRPKAADAIEAWLAQGIAAAMNLFNQAGDGGRKTTETPSSVALLPSNIP